MRTRNPLPRPLCAALVSALCLFPAALNAQIHVNASAPAPGDGSTWANAFPNLQDALSAAAPGDTVWVAAGTYRPDLGAAVSPGDVTASFVLVDDVALYGGFDGSETSLASRAGLFEQTVLLGELDGGAASLNLVRAEGCGPDAILDGFTLDGGFVFDAGAAGACLSLSLASPTVTNCTFRDAWAERGAGVSVGPLCAPTFSDCRWEGLFAVDGGGMVVAGGGAPRLERCTFVGCNAEERGGALMLDALSAAVMVDCTFDGNAAENLHGGAAAMRNADPAFLRCRFVGNRASYGGALSTEQGARPLVVSSLFSGNFAYFGGGAVHTSQSTPILVGCTLWANSSQRGGGLDIGDAVSQGTSVTGSILWGNWCFGIACGNGQVGGAEPLVSFSVVQDLPPWWSGVGNQAADPLFVDADGLDLVAGTADDDLRLAAGSPAIDAGRVDALPPDLHDVDGDGNGVELFPLDLEGLLRFQDDPATDDGGAGAVPVVDVGCHEFPSTLTCAQHLGLGGPGSATLSVCGDPLTTSAGWADLEVRYAPASAPVILVIGLTLAPTPTHGGVLAPFPWDLLLDATTDGAGVLVLDVRGSDGAPTSVYLQAVLPAPGGPWFTNAVETRIGL
jgi:hypothetical protein